SRSIGNPVGCWFSEARRIVPLSCSYNSKLELLFDKVEAFAAGETLPPVDVNCSGKGWGRCYEPIGSAHYWWCKETGFLSNYCDKPFDYM
ncbi:hypothetical protein PN652_18910, partial [Odoribacter splanchnicus]|uniref:hypothetical protein n=1 Tax=Odoribacter splanchnicus TaxID=28118 RepID=UPI00232D7115